MTQSSDPRRRCVVLGASNVTLGFGDIVRAAVAELGGPLEVAAADGHGRSYGIESRVAGRSLSSILDCGLWPRLEAAERRETFALVTDVGNDIAYQQAVPDIADWVARCLDRLLELGARCVLTLPPLERLRLLTPRQFLVARTLLFPGRVFSLEDTLRRVEELDARLREIAAARQLPAIAPRREWYGTDPIHIRRGLRSTVWRGVLSAWSRGETAPPRPAPRLAVPGFLRRAPERRRILGIERRREQPSARLRDGTTLSLY